ncbi:hypothetical protein MSAN_00594600 [Mycena sanguinolenta]|uniref:Uncharacterized protein n=1 Tax=Mycena sanguinolenta TaxID=230812 RepID=A0A8H7DIT2_9AGAR|nr:hypothetical protein MSAN_00594600 [Mycena sanguinolenta]
MDCQFSFGPNLSYVCNANGWACSDEGLPEEMLRTFADNTHPHAMDSPLDVALAMEEGTYLMRWKATNGTNYRDDETLVGSNYARLSEFIRSVTSDGACTTRTTFGPRFSYFSICPTGCSWQNIPRILEDEIQNSMKVRQPICVALGVDESYVALFDDGSITLELYDRYPGVETMINNRGHKGGIAYIALSPFVAGEYYGVYGDGTTAWWLPTSWTKDVTMASQGIQPVPQKTRAQSSSAKHGTNWAEVLELGVKLSELANNLTEIVNPGN